MTAFLQRTLHNHSLRACFVQRQVCKKGADYEIKLLPLSLCCMAERSDSSPLLYCKHAEKLDTVIEIFEDVNHRGM